MAPPTIAQVVSYDGNSFPEDVGWTRSNAVNPSDRLLENGWLVQHSFALPCPPGCGTQDFYHRDPTPATDWFMTWVVETDGPPAFSAVAPAVIAAGGFAGVLYHFTIGNDQVRFLRDPKLPLVFSNIAPSVPHTYRLELRGTESYTFLIDGVVIDSGVPEGPYPDPDACIAFGARATSLDNNTTRWDYIRYGVLPIDGSLDFNTDGAVDDFETPFFAECMLGPGLDAGPGCRWADTDADTDVDCADRDAFIAAWTGSGDPPPLAACLGPTAPIPAVSHWGVAVASLMVLIAGSLVFCHRLPVVAHR